MDKKYHCSKEVYKVFVDLSEVLFLLINNASNYSEVISEKMSTALTSINKLVDLSKGNK